MAQLKNTTVNDFGFLQLPEGTTAQRPSSPVAGMIRYNTTTNSAELYNGNTWRAIHTGSVEATGGTVVDTQVGGIAYRIHVFTTVGTSTFTVTQGGEVEYLIVAGGGGGGSSPTNNNDGCGGGGAGGFLTGNFTVTPQSYTVAVGAGGLGINAAVTNGTNGGNSSAFGFTAIGGGGGATQNTAGLSGGSGGGAGNGGGSGPYPGGAGTAGQGNSGGLISTGANNWVGSGGGGAGEAGRSGNQGVAGQGRGGTGLASNITGSAVFYAGGGGGGASGGRLGGGGGTQTGVAPRGGTGGGGGGYHRGKAPSGAPNTGGGGGGGLGNTDAWGGDGGSGIVVIRYRKNSSTVSQPNRILNSSLPAASEKWNVSEVQRFVPSITPRVLIHAESEGLNNVNGYRLTRVDINGTTVLNGSTPRSLRITQLRRNGTGWQYVNSITYDAYGSEPQANNALAYLQTFGSGDLLILTTYDHINNHAILNTELNTQFLSTAGINFTVRSNRDSHLLVAIKNERLLYENYRFEGRPGFTTSIWLE